MKVLGTEVLELFLLKHADARGAIASWLKEADSANWQTPHELKARYATASFLGGNTVIFNIKGNSYRLETVVAYRTAIILVEWVGTHAEYSSR